MQLTSPRLLLRPFTAGDFAAVHAFASDPLVTRYTDWGPNDESDSRAFLEGSIKPTALPHDDDFTFAVTRLGTSEVIGSAAVWMDSQAHGRAEAGYTLAADAWGQGYGTEVARILVDFALKDLGAFRVAATFHPANAASIRVLEKSGLVYEGRLRGHLLVRGSRRDSLMFSVLETDRV